MGAALGLILGAATGYAGEKYREKQQGEQLALKMYSEHPEALAMNKEAQAHLKKISPELLDVLLPVGQMRMQANAAYQQQFGGGAPTTTPTGGAPPPGTQMIAGGAPSGGGGIAPVSTGPAPTASAPNYDQQIAEQQNLLKKYQEFDSRYGQGLEQWQKDAIKEHIQQANKNIDRLTSEKRQSAQFAEQEKLRAQSEAAAAERQTKAEAERDKRQQAFFAHTDDMERRHEDFRDHLEALKDARTKGTQDKAEKTVIASLTKERNSILAKFKGTDADQTYRQQEVSSYNQGLDVLAAGSDHPEKFEALKLELGEPGAGYLGTSIGAKPGEVKPAADVKLKTDDPLIGKATKQADGQHRLKDKIYTVKGGKIVGYTDAAGG